MCFLWNCLQVNARGPHWLIKIGLCAWWHEAITWTNVDQVLWCHMVSLGHNELPELKLYDYKTLMLLNIGERFAKFQVSPHAFSMKSDLKLCKHFTIVEVTLTLQCIFGKKILPQNREASGLPGTGGAQHNSVSTCTETICTVPWNPLTACGLFYLGS